MIAYNKIGHVFKVYLKGISLSHGFILQNIPADILGEAVCCYIDAMKDSQKALEEPDYFANAKKTLGITEDEEHEK